MSGLAERIVKMSNFDSELISIINELLDFSYRKCNTNSDLKYYDEIARKFTNLLERKNKSESKRN